MIAGSRHTVTIALPSNPLAVKPMKVEVALPNNPLTVHGFLEESAAKNPLSFYTLALFTVLQWIATAVTVIKWVLEFYADFCTLTGRPTETPPAEDEAVDPPTEAPPPERQWWKFAYSLNWNDESKKIHFNKACFQLKGRKPTARLICSSCGYKLD